MFDFQDFSESRNNATSNQDNLLEVSVAQYSGLLVADWIENCCLIIADNGVISLVNTETFKLLLDSNLSE